MIRFLLTCVAGAALVAGCAFPGFGAAGVQAGQSREQVIASAGRPTATVPLPGGGQRLQYSLQPMGQQAWMVDLDAAGKVTSARQVFTATEFQRIQPGWSRADVEREFGAPARDEHVGSWNGPIMTYRWYEDRDMFWHVYLDPQGVVRRSHPAFEETRVTNPDNGVGVLP